jgi:UDP-glucose 4-epimerase
MMKNMPNIAEASFCILGASGFIGTNLVLRLSEVAKSVRAVSRTGQPKNVAASHITWFSQDIEDVSRLQPVLKDCDVVIHLVSSTNPGTGDALKQAGIKENLVPTLKLLDLCATSGGGKIVFLSSGGSVYGNAEEIPTPETAATNPLSSYAVNKLSIEKFLAV